MNEGGVHAGKRKQDEGAVNFLFVFLLPALLFMSPPWQALSREGPRRNQRPNAKPATRGLTAPCGLRPPSASFVPPGGSVQQDQRLDIRQVHVTSPGR